MQLVGALCIAWATLTAWLALARYGAVHNQTFDLALYARLAWGVAHGELSDPIGGGHFFGGHLSLVLLPLGLLGRVFGTVPVLLIAQSLCVALAALPIAALAMRRLGTPAGVVAAISFLFYPNLGHVTTYEFHPGNLAVLPLCYALDALDRQSPRALLWLCVAVVACRASLALQTLMLGVLALRSGAAMRRTGLRIALFSLAYFALFMWFSSPALHNTTPTSASLHFGKWGGSPFGVLTSLLRDPALVAQHFTAPARLLYPLLVLAPLACLALLRPRLLLVALPPLAQNLVSEFPTSIALYSHYLTPTVPALVAASIEGLAWLRVRTGPKLAVRNLGLGAIAATAVTGSVVCGGLPWSRDFRRADFTHDQDSASALAVLTQIDAHASVQVPDPLLPHLAERRVVHRAPPPERATEYVVLDISHRRRFARSEDLLRTVEEPDVRRWLGRTDHQLLLARGDLLLLRRGLPARAGLVRDYFVEGAAPTPGVALTACLSVREARLRGTTLWLEFVAQGPCSEDLAIRLGADAKPTRVDLLFDGLLSPAQLKLGDVLRSRHTLSAKERAAVLQHGLRIGVLRTSGAPPEPTDPVAIEVPLQIGR